MLLFILTTSVSTGTVSEIAHVTVVPIETKTLIDFSFKDIG